MKADIDSDGRLLIRPTTLTEETALKEWAAAIARKCDPADMHWLGPIVGLLALRDEDREQSAVRRPC